MNIEKSLIVLSLTAISSYIIIKFFNKEKKKKLHNVGKIHSLYIYPIKSMKGIEVKIGECTKRGLKCGELEDRNFLVMDESLKKYVTAKDYKKMLTIQPSIKNGILNLYSCLTQKDINIVIDDVTEKRHIIKVECYEKGICEGLDCGDDVSDFLKEALGTSNNLRLIKYSSSLFNQRKAIVHKNQTLNYPIKKDHDVQYQDEGPFMIMTTNSLDDLNNKIKDDVMSIERFRPTIMIECNENISPFNEDYWNDIYVEDVKFYHMKPCTRCVITMINSNTGSLSKNGEPLKTLRTYRLSPEKLRKVYGESPVMGVVVGILNGGIIKEGDTVYASYKNLPC